MKIARTLTISLILLPAVAQAWWNEDWKQRTVVTLNTSSAGVAVQESLTNVAVPVRLHSGNFDFVDAKPDGSDLRVLAGDDKTPLKFWIERFDGVNELALVWVQVPSVLPGTDKNTIYVYAGNDKAAADAASAGTPDSITDASTLAAFRFADKDGVATDQSGSIKASAATAIEVNGLIGPSARVNGTPIIWPGSDKLKVAAGQPFTRVALDAARRRPGDSVQTGTAAADTGRRQARGENRSDEHQRRRHRGGDLVTHCGDRSARVKRRFMWMARRREKRPCRRNSRDRGRNSGRRRLSGAHR